MGQPQQRGHERVRNVFGPTHVFCGLAPAIAIHVWSRPLGMPFLLSRRSIEEHG